jgi:phage gpG-like protein
MPTGKSLAEQLEKILLNKARTQAGMVEAAKVAEQEIRGNFEKGQSFWVKLARTTVMQRMALGFGATPILIRTGELLKRSVERVEVKDTTVTLSTSYGLASVLNNGGGNIPARPFYYFDEESKTRIYGAFLKGYLS